MEKRAFCGALQTQNVRFTGEKARETSRKARVGFLLLENFSLPAFTQVLDTLITANLIRAETFITTTFSLSGEQIMSDLGLIIRPNAALQIKSLKELDLLVVCGGLRTPLRSSQDLTRLLQAAAETPVALAGLWSGAWFLGHAGLLNGYRCTAHPEHRAAVAEVAKFSVVTSESFTVDRDRLTAGSPNGAFNMILEWMGQFHGRELVEAIVDILAFEDSRYRRVTPHLHKKISEPLRDAVNLMSANIEEPLSLAQLAEYVGRSKRQIERLFRQQLGTSPVRYYLELRLTEGRRLLQHSGLTILEVGVACGFVSPSHFSKCYTAFFGYPPSKEVRYECVKSSKTNSTKGEVFI